MNNISVDPPYNQCRRMTAFKSKNIVKINYKMEI